MTFVKSAHTWPAGCETSISTSHGRIAVCDLPGPGDPLVMIHANSLCKEAFTRQCEAFSGRLRMISIDLPGHGASSDAVDAKRTYSFGGYADAICEVLAKMKIGRLTVLGHSLGGHVALELMTRLDDLAGVMIFGTPPIPPGPDGAGLGFLPNPEMAYTGEIEITDEQALSVVTMALGPDADGEDPFFTRAVRRTDGRARRYMLEAALAGTQADERALVATSPIPLAIVNGAADPVVNLDYIDALSYRALWQNRPIRIPEAEHGVHWQKPEVFNEMLASFLQDIGASNQASF